MTESAVERRQIPLATATFKELKDFAINDMGISVPNGWKMKDLKETLVANGWEHDFIVEATPSAAAEVEESPQVPRAPAPKIAGAPGVWKPGMKTPPEVPEPLVELTVQQSEGAGGKRPYFVGVNGVGILLPRNKLIKVKLRYLRALESAVQHSFELDEETNEQIEKDVFAVPFQVKHMPSDEEIAAWLNWEAYSDDQTRSIDRAHDAEVRRRIREQERAA